MELDLGLDVPMHIVLLDDDRGMRESLAFMLQVAGYNAYAYASADEFLGKCRLDRVSGLILDQHMPRLTGLDLAWRLRAAGWTFPILLITGAPSQAIRSRAAELGIERVLTKPFAEADIMAFIEGLADRNGVASA
jgi:FixJ family two-component response regulator